MFLRTLLSSSLLFLVAACNALPTAAAAPAPESTGESSPASAKTGDGKTAEEAKTKAQQKKQKQKELRTKRRELEYAPIEQETAELDRRARAMTVEAALMRTSAELAQARRALDLFLTEQRPREVEEKKISLDMTTHRAEEAKEELGELVAMYDADEFAKTTKELVLKRGQRQAQIAERSLAVAKKASVEFEQHTLPQRERELRQKVANSEVEHQKADLDAAKARIEQNIAERKAKQRLADLAEEIADLEKEIAELAEAATKAPS